jgi:hypothetical protein
VPPTAIESATFAPIAGRPTGSPSAKTFVWNPEVFASSAAAASAPPRVSRPP